MLTVSKLVHFSGVCGLFYNYCNGIVFSNRSAVFPTTSMGFASLCLRNALALLPEDPLDIPPAPADESSDTRSVLLYRLDMYKNSTVSLHDFLFGC